MNAPADPSERIVEIFREILALSGTSVATGGQTSEVSDQRAEGSETDVQGLPKSESENRRSDISLSTVSQKQTLSALSERSAPPSQRQRPTLNSESLREQAFNNRTLKSKVE
jgi:hypothetical protein